MDTKNAFIIFGGPIYTMNNSEIQNVEECVVYKEGKIIYVGDKDVALNKYRNLEKLDLMGNVLLPGFIDTHCHLSFTGEMSVLPNVFDIDNIQDCLDLFKREAEKIKDGGVLLINGFGGKAIKEKRMPTLEEMDLAVEKIPLFCKTAGTHATLVNTKGLELITKIASEKGIRINADAYKTGILTNEANLLAFSLSSQFMSDKQKNDLDKMIINECSQNGIVAVHTLEGKVLENDLEVKHLLDNKEIFPFDLRIYYQTTNINEVKKLGLKQIGGCFNCLLDGDVDPGTAAFREVYTNNPTNKGKLYFTQDELNDFFDQANKNNLQICMHAIGDAAIDQALNAYEYALNKHPRKDHRHRIEHFEICDYDLIKKAKELGVLLAMQPVFDYYWDYKTYVPYIGEERAKKRCMLRAILDNKIIVGGGSDAPVTSMNPFLSIHAAVNHSVEKSRVSVYEAIKMHTIDAAYLGFQEKIRGSIEVGKSADFVIISSDPFKIESSNLDKIEILKTIYKGKCVYKKEV